MSATPTEHAQDEAEAVHGHAFDSPEEVAHAKQHAWQNMGWFAVFFTLILITVANYYFSPSNNYYWILGLAAARSLVIALFMHWLFSSFSLIFRTLIFTIFFFAGMVLVSWWDSTLPHIGDPIHDYKNPNAIAPNMGTP